MKIIILPGNSKSNKEWADNAELNFLSSDKTSERYKQYYSHWNTDEQINLDIEVKKLVKEAGDTGNCVVFAKSAGSVLAISAVDAGLINPSKCVFVGLPIPSDDVDTKNTLEMLKKFKVPTLIIQKSNDPVSSYETVRNAVNGIQNIEIVEIEGDNHKYDDYEIINSLSEKFLR